MSKYITAGLLGPSSAQVARDARVADEAGLQLKGQFTDPQAAVEFCQLCSPDLLLVGIPADPKDAFTDIGNSVPDVPLIFLVEPLGWPRLTLPAPGLVYAILERDVEAEELRAAYEVALARHAEMHGLKVQLAEMRQALEDRKTVEKAKGIVMQRLGLSEEAAYRYLQRQASMHNQKLIATAQAILEMPEAVQK